LKLFRSGPLSFFGSGFTSRKRGMTSLANNVMFSIRIGMVVTAFELSQLFEKS
jgi:hypothetical protein